MAAATEACGGHECQCTGEDEAATEATVPASAPRKPRFVGRGAAKNVITIKKGPGRFVGQPRNQQQVVHGIPESLLTDPALNEMITTTLPPNYQFEIHKTIHKITESGARRVALQMPEGLLVYATAISDILERFAGVEVVIMGDVTYGACCVDDFTAAALGCDFLVHYGHSCLVPVDITSSLAVLYVFVDIAIDLTHLLATLQHNFSPSTRLCLFSTIQFATALRRAVLPLQQHFARLVIPQAAPLSPGEVLGCTAPPLSAADFDAYVYIGDGRFHLESIMIANPGLPAYRYDPYSKVFSQEFYAIDEMHRLRTTAIATAQSAQRFGLIMGTLGRQGAPSVVQRLEQLLQQAGKSYVLVMMSEIFPQRLARFPEVEAWIQVACPRLSIDWGHQYPRPLLNPYEAEVALNPAMSWQPVYPQDFYSAKGGQWSVKGSQTAVDS
jgi:2-(3-amino-3-carboxypropyl)histidine synthase